MFLGVNKMKRILALLLVAILAMTVVFGQVGSPNTECQDNGFDYGIAKYQCGSTSPEEGDGTGLSVTWNAVMFNDEEVQCGSADWTSTYEIAGVLVKSATNTDVWPGGMSGTVEGWETTNPQDQPILHSISHITFCGDEHQVPEFSTLTFGAAIIGAGLALVFLRKR